jgi:hypothetical protein
MHFRVIQDIPLKSAVFELDNVFILVSRSRVNYSEQFIPPSPSFCRAQKGLNLDYIVQCDANRNLYGGESLST